MPYVSDFRESLVGKHTIGYGLFAPFNFRDVNEFTARILNCYDIGMKQKQIQTSSDKEAITMAEILSVAGLFLVRVGLPVLVLVLLGILIDRWQTGREAEALRKYKPDLTVMEEDKSDEEESKAA